MAKLIDISEWPEQPWWNTGGTRSKKVYLCPSDGYLYYFKQSFNKGKRNYKYEFWSEVIAAELGQSMGFDILSYDVAVRNGVVGCISKSMIDPSTEELIEGGKYLTAFDNTFQPNNYSTRNRYDLQLIIAALVSFGREKYLPNIIEMLVFDALIGNSDRHQENWALVHVNSRLTGIITEMNREVESGALERMHGWLRKIIEPFYAQKGKWKKDVDKARLLLPKGTRFSPIYDSGCSFGRELEDQAIQALLDSPEKMLKYVNDGKCEIHWHQKKLPHFEMLRQMMQNPDLSRIVRDSIIHAKKKYSSSNVAAIVEDIDIELRKIMPQEALPPARKAFIRAVVHLRMEALEALLIEK